VVTEAAHPTLDLKSLLVRRLEADRLRLPPYPAIALRLQQLAADERCTTQHLCATIRADAALVTALLRNANVAAFGGACQATTLERAVQRLGVRHMLRIALAQSVGAVVSASGTFVLLRRDIWRRSLLAARVAAELAPARGVDPDAAFIAGLLHDIGAIAVLVGLEDLHVELPTLPASQWRTFVDRLQPRFGAVLADRWKLPEAIAHAVQHCFSVDRYAGPHAALVELTATAVCAITILERTPAAGVAQLRVLSEISAEERERVGALLPEIAQLMETFEPRDAVVVTLKQATAEPPRATIDGGWPIDYLVTCRSESYTAYALAPDAVLLRGLHPLATSWLAPLVMHCGSFELEMLANIKSCTVDANGEHRIVAQPFALGGVSKQQWLNLLQRTRPVEH